MSTDDSSKPAESIEQFLREEIEKTERARRIISYGGGAFVLFLIGYFSFMLFMVTTFLDPENAAYAISSQVEATVPKFLSDTQQALVAKAPVLAEEVTAMFFRVIPELRKVAETQIDFTHQDMIPQLSDGFSAIISNYVKDNSQTLKAFADDHDTEAFAEFFTSELLNSFGKYLDQEMRSEFEGRDMSYFTENSLVALQAMNAHLSDLIAADASELDRKSRLQRRILSAVVNRLILLEEDSSGRSGVTGLLRP